MSDLLTVVGKNGGIEEKATGWFEVKVMVPGKEYPVKLATKRSSLIDEVRALGTEVGTFHYKETESDRINERTQKPFINRYLEQVEQGATAAASAVTAGGSRDNVDWDAKDRRDFRSRAWAITISAFVGTIKPDEDPVLVYNRLRPFQRLLYTDIVQELEPNNPNREHQQQPEAQPQQQQLETPPADEPPHYEHGDDDIPFLWLDTYAVEPGQTEWRDPWRRG